MSKPSPARYRTTNWSSYTASLKKRGSLLVWLDKEMTWLAPRDGRPSVFSDAAIRFCLTIKVLATDDRHGGQLAEGGELGLGRA